MIPCPPLRLCVRGLALCITLAGRLGFFVVHQSSLGLSDRSTMQTDAIENAVILLGRGGYSSPPRRQIERLAAAQWWPAVCRKRC